MQTPVSSFTSYEHYEALARAVMETILPRWHQTEQTHRQQNAKRVYYVSMEFLIGRSLQNHVLNLSLELAMRRLCRENGWDWEAVVEQEPDPGLGNGGLGRLAACLLDSMATLHIPAMGYGLRYEYGLFQRTLRDGWQQEQPDPWLSRPDPWEKARPDEAVEVHLACSFEVRRGSFRIIPNRPSALVGVPCDRPVVGYGGETINTLRLWRPLAAQGFDFPRFCTGDFVGALSGTLTAGTLTRVLYPDDSTTMGRVLRFVQEYFMVTCSVADMVRRFRQQDQDWSRLPDRAAIQLNDTHPAMAVPELLRVLLDEAHLDWDPAWDITRRVCAYTNHTLLPEALETWPVRFFRAIAPRHLELIEEIQRRFEHDVRAAHPGEASTPSGTGERRCHRMGLIDRRRGGRVRMAHLAMVGCHAVNGVSAIHTELLRTRVAKDFVEMFPERFSNKTNGITPRRWLAQANPYLSTLITEAIGTGWITDLDQIEKLRPLAEDRAFRQAFCRAKHKAKVRLADWLKARCGLEVDPDTMFDSQIKRIHEYKRQLLNALHVVILYNRLRKEPDLDVPARTFFFAGKAAPSYFMAKRIIKFINSVAAVVNSDPVASRKIKVVFVPDYGVSVAERLIAATDLSEQISTAGFEASGTGNMKFMLNGALTIGTRDGATIEMAQAVGEENMFLFGLSAEQVIQTWGWYDPKWHYENEPEIKAALDLVFKDHFSRSERGVFEPLKEALLVRGDYFMHLADLGSYAAAQEQVNALYRQPEEWTRKAILNVAASGRFSSDRTVREYAREIWHVL